MSENTTSVIKTQRRKKLYAIEMFGGKCQICGYNKCPNALEFHHVESNNKKEKPAYVIMRWSWERAKKELDKCILVCANCHREIHYKELDVTFLDLVLPWIEIECATCHHLFETKRVDQKYCSISCSRHGSRKTTRPTEEELKRFLDESIPFTKLGRMYGVSDNAVRKWAKKYNLIE